MRKAWGGVVTLKPDSSPLPLRALRLAHQDKNYPRCSWSAFLKSLNSLRERPILFSHLSEARVNKNCAEWLQSDPFVLQWVHSKNCLRSPPSWPAAILPAFKHRLIPTPFDICNVDMKFKATRTSKAYTHYLKLILYCMGFSLGQLSVMLGESERDIERDMYCAIETFWERPQFLLWASATNFSRSLMPPHLSGLSLKEKGTIVQKLRANPFLLYEEEARPFLDSPRYVTYLVYGSPKKPRITKKCRLYYTKEA